MMNKTILKGLLAAQALETARAAKNYGLGIDPSSMEDGETPKIGSDALGNIPNALAELIVMKHAHYYVSDEQEHCFPSEDNVVTGVKEMADSVIGRYVFGVDFANGDWVKKEDSKSRVERLLLRPDRSTWADIDEPEADIMTFPKSENFEQNEIDWCGFNLKITMDKPAKSVQELQTKEFQERIVNELAREIALTPEGEGMASWRDKMMANDHSGHDLVPSFLQEELRQKILGENAVDRLSDIKDLQMPGNWHAGPEKIELDAGFVPTKSQFATFPRYKSGMNAPESVELDFVSLKMGGEYGENAEWRRQETLLEKQDRIEKEGRKEEKSRANPVRHTPANIYASLQKTASFEKLEDDADDTKKPERKFMATGQSDRDSHGSGFEFQFRGNGEVDKRGATQMGAWNQEARSYVLKNLGNVIKVSEQQLPVYDAVNPNLLAAQEMFSDAFTEAADNENNIYVRALSNTKTYQEAQTDFAGEEDDRVKKVTNVITKLFKSILREEPSQSKTLADVFKTEVESGEFEETVSKYARTMGSHGQLDAICGTNIYGLASEWQEHLFNTEITRLRDLGLRHIRQWQTHSGLMKLLGTVGNDKYMSRGPRDLATYLLAHNGSIEKFCERFYSGPKAKYYKNVNMGGEFMNRFSGSKDNKDTNNNKVAAWKLRRPVILFNVPDLTVDDLSFTGAEAYTLLLSKAIMNDQVDGSKSVGIIPVMWNDEFKLSEQAVNAVRARIAERSASADEGDSDDSS
jgi:hypothetical protein